MQINSHTYPGEGITILWQPDKCIHSAICARGLPLVFDPRRRPWIDTGKSDTATITEQVKKCPSGALSLLKDR